MICNKELQRQASSALETSSLGFADLEVHPMRQASKLQPQAFDQSHDVLRSADNYFRQLTRADTGVLDALHPLMKLTAALTFLPGLVRPVRQIDRSSGLVRRGVYS